jgi:hypothetical protein
VPGAALLTRPSDMQGLEKLMGWLCGSKVTIDFTIAPLDQTNACRAGYGILTSSLTRGPLGAWGPCIHSRPSDMRGNAGLEKLMVWWVKVDRFTIAPLDQTNACRAGAMEPSTSSLTRGPWVPGAALHLTPAL